VATLHAHNNEIAYHIGDNDNGIITVADIPLVHNQNNTIVLEDSAEDNGANGANDSKDNKEDNTSTYLGDAENSPDNTPDNTLACHDKEVANEGEALGLCRSC
jgi:hypothetical protein